MERSRGVILLAAAAIAVACGGSSRAIAATAPVISIPTVPIGNPGNPGRPQFEGAFGGVSRIYRLGKYEVTNDQYAFFLNRVDATAANARQLYNPLMTADPHGGILLDPAAPAGARYRIKEGRGQYPVVFVSWLDAMRFSNWLHNGQTAGGTETGAYTIPQQTQHFPSEFVERNPGALWFVPSEDEWFKAAYHQNDGVTGNYWEFPNRSHDPPFSVPPPGADSAQRANAANYYRDDYVDNDVDNGYALTGSLSLDATINYLTRAGAYPESVSPYGAYDMAGNAFEWVDLAANTYGQGLRGSSWYGRSLYAWSYFRESTFPAYAENSDLGFRVARAPEPSVYAMLAVVAPWLLPRFASRRRASPP